MLLFLHKAGTFGDVYSSKIVLEWRRNSSAPARRFGVLPRAVTFSEVSPSTGAGVVCSEAPNERSYFTIP